MGIVISVVHSVFSCHTLSISPSQTEEEKEYEQVDANIATELSYTFIIGHL